MLRKCRVDGPLHMADFVSVGKYAGWPSEFKLNLFLKVRQIVTECRFYSVAIVIKHGEFNEVVTEEIRKEVIGPYAFAFFSAVLANARAIEMSKLFEGKVNYVVDDGVARKYQLEEAHRVIFNLERQSTPPRRVGSFRFSTDDTTPELQAADAIAWSARRQYLEGSFPEGFEPLRELLNSNTHETVLLDRQAISMLGDVIRRWIARRGSMPSLAEVVRK